MVHPTVTIQISEVSVPSTPSWLGEAAAFAHILRHLGQLETIEQRVWFARARFGYYDALDFIAVLIGYAVSGEPTLKAFYERLLPFAEPFMALFGRHQLPHRSTLSRFLAALDQPMVEALRTLFQEDLLARKPFASPGGVFDRVGKQWMVVDVDGTRQAARQRALPQTESLPAPPSSCAIRSAHQAIRAQAGRSGAHPHGHAPSAYAPVSGYLWRTRQWRLPRRTCDTKVVLLAVSTVIPS